MHRAAWAVVAIACLSAVARADAIDDRVAELSASNYKLRLASALALAKSADARALRALAGLLDGAAEKSLRRIAVVAIAKRAPAAPAALRADLLRALSAAARSDRDAKVRAAAGRAAKRLAALVDTDEAPAKPSESPVGQVPAKGDAPKLFVRVSSASDATQRLSSETLGALTKAVHRAVTQSGFETTWPGALPTSAELTARAARAFIVASTVKKLEVKKGHGAEISCTISITVAPWHGVDGKELWEADRVATAAGSARAETGTSAKEISGGMRDCVEAVASEVASRQVAPFLRRMAK